VDALVTQAKVPRAVAGKALADAQRRPNQAVPVATLPQADYDQIRDVIHPVPGLSFEQAVGREYHGPASTRPLLGTVGPVTADDLKELGPAYQAGDQTGHGNGLEEAFERRLAGTPSGEVRLVGKDGQTVKVLHSFAGKDGQPLETTLDPRVQEAGQAALVPWPSRPPWSRCGPPPAPWWRWSTPRSRATTGPCWAATRPGRPSRWSPPPPCWPGAAPRRPGRLPQAGQGRRPHLRQLRGRGAGPDPVLQRLRQLLQHRLRAAGGQALDGDQLAAAAARFGFGLDPSVGIPAVTSRVPPPSDTADLASEAFGQGRVTASPLQMATVAATVAAGRWHHPTLVTGEAPEPGVPDESGSNDSGGSAPAKSPDPLDPKVAGTLRTLMRQVVTQGTAADAGLPDTVAGKTGTAEFGTGDPLPTHAWFIGFRGDLAFAVLVEDGGVGGRVAAPAAARFLRGL
jgi:cell division protein FtsI/penicillin-binding protein 2